MVTLRGARLCCWLCYLCWFHLDLNCHCNFTDQLIKSNKITFVHLSKKKWTKKKFTKARSKRIELYQHVLVVYLIQQQSVVSFRYRYIQSQISRMRTFNHMFHYCQNSRSTERSSWNNLNPNRIPFKRIRCRKTRKYYNGAER